MKVENFKKYAYIFIGQFIGAAAFSRILIPNKLVAVGLGGVATIINNLTNVNIQLLLIIICLPIIIWAFFLHKKELLFYAALCYGLFTFYIGIADAFLPAFVTDPIIASVAGGILMGISGGMVISRGVANGPEAIVALHLKEKYDITVGTFFMVMNTVIIFSSIIYGDLTMIVYSLISNYISGKITDYVVIGTKRYFAVNIVSEHYLEITEFIHKELHRGVTFIQSMDTITLSKKMLLKTVISKRELVRLREYVGHLDDDSFVYTVESASIIGGGFE